MLKYLWEATFNDGRKIKQPQDDRYSKHNEETDHNPSAFRDILDHQKKSPVAIFSIRNSEQDIYAVNLTTGEFFINGSVVMLEQPMDELKNRKLIYFRTKRMDMQTGDQYVHSYSFGYEAKDSKGKNIQKVVSVV